MLTGCTTKFRLKSPILAVRVLNNLVPGAKVFGTVTYLPIDSLMELRGTSAFSELPGVSVIVEGNEYAAFVQDVIEKSEQVH